MSEPLIVRYRRPLLFVTALFIVLGALGAVQAAALDNWALAGSLAVTTVALVVGYTIVRDFNDPK